MKKLLLSIFIGTLITLPELAISADTPQQTANMVAVKSPPQAKDPVTECAEIETQKGVKKTGLINKDKNTKECIVTECKNGYKISSNQKSCEQKTNVDICTENGGTYDGTNCTCKDKTKEWDKDKQKCVDKGTKKKRCEDLGGTWNEKSGTCDGVDCTDDNTVYDAQKIKCVDKLKREHNEAELDELQDKVDAAKAKEQSFANRMLSGATMAATGAGGQMLASALAEQKADKDAEQEMSAYLATFKCNWGSHSVPGGEQNVELAGGNELIGLYSQYVTLANDLKIRKSALDMTPGIESEPILDGATSGLYDDVGTGITSGAYASLARALMTPDGEDAKKWAAQKEATAKELKTGAITAGVGAVVGVAGNVLINHTGKKNASERLQEKYKDIIVKLEKIEKDLNNAEGPKCSEIDSNTSAGNSPNCTCTENGKQFHPDWQCYTPPKTTNADDIKAIPEPANMELVEIINIPTDIAFISAKDTLTSVAEDAIADIKRLIGDNKSLFESAKYEIHIIGHTDKTHLATNNPTNVELSQNRAEEIKNALTSGKNAIDSSNVQYKGVGSTGCTQDNHESCRYIEMKLYVNPDSISGLDGDFILGLADGMMQSK